MLMLPVVAFATAVLALGHAIAGGSLWALVDRLALMALGALDWGFVVAAASLLLLAVAGLYPRSRPFAGAIVAAIALAATAVTVAMAGATRADDVPFLLPGTVAAAIGAWLAWREWPREGVARA